MREKNRGRGPMFAVIALFLLACWLGFRGNSSSLPELYPRAQFKDATPLGGKGLRLLMQRLGYTAVRHTERVSAMPGDAGAWLLLDYQAGFSKAEGRLLLNWVSDGGTLLWAATPNWTMTSQNSGLAELRSELRVESEGRPNSGNSMDLPPFTQLSLGAASELRDGVKKVSGSGRTLKINRTFVELAGNPTGTELALIPFGKGRVIVLPDALLCTNYGLAKDDNAVLVTNFIRATVPSGTVYFDERSHDDAPGSTSKFEPNLLYYLGHGFARYASLQLLVAGLLLWAFYSRRLGTPIPLPDQEPVTRAGQFALAMGLLFRKANRPSAAAEILGDEFRRALARRVGLSPQDSDETLAAAAARATGLPVRLIDRLLLKSKNPATSEAEALADAQDMETVLRSFEQKVHG